MLYLLFFFAELGLLFLLSRMLTRELSMLLHRLTRNYHLTIHVFSLLFLPGTFVHELTHYLMALFLLVPIGRMNFTPKIEKNSIRMGSVEIGKTDPIRRLLIGVAPVVAGTILLLLTLYGATLPQVSDYWWRYFIVGYIIFEVGNTMFSSKKDLEGALALFLMSLVVIAILFIVGVRLPPLNPFIFISSTVTELIKKADLYLLIPLGLDCMTIISLKIFGKK